MKVIHNVILNVLKPGWPPIVDLVQLDTGHQIDFGIVGMDVTDCTAQVWIVKPSGLKIYNSCSVNGQRISLEITNQMLAEAGKCTGQLKIRSEDGMVTPFDFILNVHRDVSGDGLESTNEATAWEQMVDEAAGKVVDKLMPVVSTQDTDNGVQVTIAVGETSESFVIEDGHTPVRETDYWTEDDLEMINEEMQSLVIDECAKLGQVKPEFANSIDECTDTSKLYVLPDGYIYGYIRTETTRPAYTNVFDKNNAAKGYRLGSGGNTSSFDDCFVTNYIPVNPSTKYTVRLFGAGNFNDGNDRISEYSAASEANHVLQTRGSALSTSTESSGAVVFTFTTQSTTNYLRLSIQYDLDNFDTYVITLNQPIENEFISEYGWGNTGHAFVPADYEKRIIELENEMDNMGNVDGVPAYIVEEAKRVAALVASKRIIDSFSFIAVSDIHYSTGTNTPTSLIHAGKAAEYVRRYTKIDMLTMLGDYIGGADGDTKKGAIGEYFEVHKAMYSAGNGIKQIWLRGNHDRLLQSGGTTTTEEEFTLDEMYAHIGSMNADSVSVDGSGSYGYLDFEQKKIRIVYLNTSDDDGTYVWCSPSQIQWIADYALDLSDKDAPAEWGIIVLSHVPLWGGVFDYLTAVQTMLDAYNDGGSGSVVIGSTTITYNFATHGEIICLVNGHTHNFAVSTTPKDIPCFSVPQVCEGRYNEYATGSDSFRAWGEFDDSDIPVYYKKTVNTKDSTSFNVFTVDRKNRKIYAHCYGAGIDREIIY